MKTYINLIIASISFLFVIVVITFKLMVSTNYQIAGDIISHVDTSEKIVALTFDDGPSVYADDIINVLKTKNVPATFFLIGKEMDQYPEETQKLIDAGYEIGNHSYSHTHMIFKSPSFIASEIEKTNALIKISTTQDEILFRPPYGKKLIFLPLYLKSQNIKTITWDVDPLTGLGAKATAQEISQFVIKHTKPGSIILIHPWYGKQNLPRESISTIIDALKENGYQFVTVSQLLANK